MGTALSLTQVEKRYPDFFLDHVDLVLPKGSIMGFVGENGAGKTTTIKLILDLIERDGGSIQVLGKDNRAGLMDVKENLGVVLDETCFPENLNALNIDRILKKIYITWSSSVFMDYLQRFELPLKKEVKDYSRGMKMKLSIAAALAHDTKLLILDEATSGLDPVVREEIMDVFWSFIQNEEHAIFMSSHIMSDIEKIADYISFIHKGKMVFCDTKEALTDRFALYKGSAKQLNQLPKEAIKGLRENQFGASALVERNLLIGLPLETASLEDIMVYHIKGGKVV